jgi:hypothetical protein
LTRLVLSIFLGRRIVEQTGEHKKPILEDSDQLWDKEKMIPGNAKWLPGNTDRLSRKIEPELGRIESEPGEIEPSSGKEKSILGNAN